MVSDPVSVRIRPAAAAGALLRNAGPLTLVASLALPTRLCTPEDLSMTANPNRRQLLHGGAAALGYFLTAPALSAVREADSPSEKLRFASIGVGGKGDGDCDQAASFGPMVAVCDVDADYLGAKLKKHAGSKGFADFRKMLDEMGKEIDAVTVSTPDHTHAHAAVMAMRMKKHVYVQKPLTHTVWEARLMRNVARKNGVCTQMGNQGTTENGLRRAVELVQSGVIGKVTEVHVWTNRPVWPQSPAIKARPKAEEVPAYLSWDLWLAGARSGRTRTARSIRSGRTAAPTTTSTGAAGGTSAPARSATWPATRPTWRSWPSS